MYEFKLRVFTRKNLLFSCLYDGTLCAFVWGGLFEIGIFSFVPLKRMLIVRGRLPCEATKLGLSLEEFP